jgi:hypothetical protein
VSPVRYELGFYIPEDGSCELGNEPSGSIKCWETTERLHNLWPLERYSALQS